MRKMYRLMYTCHAVTVWILICIALRTYALWRCAMAVRMRSTECPQVTSFDSHACGLPSETSLCSASYVSCQRDTARICCCRAQFAAVRRAAAPGEWWDGETDRRTDRRTPDSFIDPAPRSLHIWAVSIKHKCVVYTVLKCQSCFI